MEFLTQSGNQNELDVNDLYDQFDELILRIETGDGLIEEIDLQTLQIDPSTSSDGFMSTQEWFYTIDITNEHLSQLDKARSCCIQKYNMFKKKSA